MFNLPLVVPPLSQAAADAEVYDMPYIARSLAGVMDEARNKLRSLFPAGFCI